MIHLDRGHSSAIAGHSKSNLILADPPHADQHSILSWSPSAHTDTSFYHEPQEPFTLTSDAPKHTTPSDPASGQKEEQPASTTNHGPITPGDAEEPKLPEPSPSSPADPRSPVADTSSSLSPPPDAATPGAAAAPEANVDKPPAGGGEAAAGQVEAPREDKANPVEEASRASTPLSELSSAPDDEEEDKTKEGEASAGGPGPGGHKETHEADGPNKSVQEGATSKGHASNAQSPREAPPEASSSFSNHAKSASDAKGSSIGHSSSSLASSPFSHSDIASLGSDVALLNHVPNLTASAGAKVDPKVVITLELTNQLLSVMMALLARGVPHEDPLHSQYAVNVQSNLAWLAAAADGKEKGRNTVPLPKMVPPPPIDFLPMDRIQQLYAEMPVIFAKEIARREEASSTPSGIPHADLQNGLKRGRPDELFPDLANKRRDTGDSKLSTPIAPTPQLSNAVPPQMNAGMLPSTGNPMSAVPSLQGTPAPRLGSPAMPPPAVPPGMMGGSNEAQMLAARERARQMQMQQMQRQSMQQQQQQLAESSRQMSPPHVQPGGMGMSNMAGPSSMGSMQQQQQGSRSIQQQIQGNPVLMRQYQILQTPTHPLTHYLHQQVPNFTSLSIQRQLQHVHNAQMILQQRQQMAKEAGAQNMMNPSMLVNAGMSPGQISPTRPMQQVAMSSPSSTGGMPFGNQGAGSGMGMNGAGLNPQQQALFAGMNPQQKQLYLMQQQQQQLRNGGMSNQGMMNPQMLAAAQERMQQQQQQRMAQASMNANAGMQMPGAMDASGHIPALRSNPSMSNIARNTRTPSDSAPSPAAGMSQRISGHAPDDLQRAMMLQQAQQRGMTPQQMMQQNAGGGMPQMNFQQNMQRQMSPMGQGPGSYGMSPPNSAGPGAGFGGGMQGGMQGGMGGTPQPGTGGQNQWQQNANGLGNGQFPFAPSPAASQHHSDPSMTPRQMSATPAPGQAMAQNSPQVDLGGLSEFGDIFNWEQ
ncbi:hypothetical protein DAEQUDRAFT_720655 [Daedalea quercina L-15889]|uniref:Uncharacterized protein n=1 Tax=Daedalea quercina L-15889 TaxID=1314783 RepID=A0A165U707_9APHY|nr:hypothetical protein DAEQUDRAFT_720655 [Daedalea quercina L-15889]